MITITDIRINLVKGDDKLKAYGTIIINDSFLVSDLRVIESDDGFFVAMPSRRKRDGSFKDIAYPLNNDLRNKYNIFSFDYDLTINTNFIETKTKKATDKPRYFTQKVEGVRYVYTL